MISSYSANYNQIYKNRGDIKIVKIWMPYRIWINKMLRKIIGNESIKVVDFGCNMKSDFYLRCKKLNVKNYYGYDIDNSSVFWLKDNNIFVDFWHTEEKFNIINASQVFEHLTLEERTSFLKRCREILNDGGYLLIDIPFIENLNGLFYHKDLTHKPVSSTDDPLLIKNFGFNFNHVYLVGSRGLRPIFNLFNLLLFGSFQQTLQIVAIKKIMDDNNLTSLDKK